MTMVNSGLKGLSEQATFVCLRSLCQKQTTAADYYCSQQLPLFVFAWMSLFRTVSYTAYHDIQTQRHRERHPHSPVMYCVSRVALKTMYHKVHYICTTISSIDLEK